MPKSQRWRGWEKLQPGGATLGRVWVSHCPLSPSRGLGGGEAYMLFPVMLSQTCDSGGPQLSQEARVAETPAEPGAGEHGQGRAC